MAQTLAIPKYPILSIGEATHTLHKYNYKTFTFTILEWRHKEPSLHDNIGFVQEQVELCLSQATGDAE